MHFLLTNDDGIDAPGLAALEVAVRALPGARVTVVAPAVEHSQCGHRVTTHGPICAERVGEARHRVHGSPADCVRVALFGLEIRPDFVVAGINQGGNLGQDVVISGTVAAAREAAYHGLGAAAFSHYQIRGVAMDWDRASRWVAALLPALLARPVDGAGLWNVNLPHHPPGPMDLPEVTHAPLERAPLNVSYRRELRADGHLDCHYDASYSERPRAGESDVAVCFGGRVSVTRVGLA